MFTIYITLKSFESYYIKKNTIFLKNLLLFTKNNTLNINRINIKEILQQGCIPAQQIEKKRGLKISRKLSLQRSTSKKTDAVEKHGLFCSPALFYAAHDIRDTEKTTSDSDVTRNKRLPQNKNSEHQGFFGPKFFSDSISPEQAEQPQSFPEERPMLSLGREKESIRQKRNGKPLNQTAYRMFCTENLNIENEKKINEINLPVKQKLFTVLRSVHVHKKSRLQFHFTYFIKKLTFQAANIKMMFLILYLLKNAKFYGVELEISLNHKTV